MPNIAITAVLAGEFVLYVGNDNTLSVTLTQTSGGSTITDATVQFTLNDATGTNVTGLSWPQTLAHTSNGVYEVTLQETLAIVDKSEYTGIMTASTPGGLNGNWEDIYVAREGTLS